MKMFLLFMFIISVNGQWWCNKYLDWQVDFGLCGDYSSIPIEKGIAENYPCDQGLGDDPSVVLFRDFENKSDTIKWFESAWFNAEQHGYSWAGNQGIGGGSAINITSTVGQHWPEELTQWFNESIDRYGEPGPAGTDQIYVRFYRRYQPGYQMQAHKSPGVYAYCCDPSTVPGAGHVPDGTDKFSTKIVINDAGEPLLYSYHPDQEGGYGDALFQNLLTVQFKFESDTWYCVEMMLKANTPGQRDGEVALWIDGKRIMYYSNMKFRDIASLKINRPLHSMWMDSNAQYAQTVWDDQIVWATEYVGPRAQCVNVTTSQPTSSTTAPTTNEPTTNRPTNQPTSSTAAPTTNEPTTNNPTIVTTEQPTTTNPYDCDSNISPSGYTCLQYYQWENCNAAWMVGHCCRYCPDACNCINTGNPFDCSSDISPQASNTCVQYKSWGDCDSNWMRGYCCTSCPAGCGCVAMTPASTTNNPTTHAPTTPEPTTNNPTTTFPTTFQPTTNHQTTHTPTTSQPTTHTPTSSKPTNNPTTHTPTTSEPTTNNPTTHTPTTTFPTTNNPTTNNPTTNNPTTNNPTTNNPTTNNPTTSNPTIVTTNQPTTTNPYDCDSNISPSGYTCLQYYQWGNCNAAWMAGHCCRYCPDACNCINTENPFDCSSDISPSSSYTCVQYESWGLCDKSWMRGLCCTSCPAGCNCAQPLINNNNTYSDSLYTRYKIYIFIFACIIIFCGLFCIIYVLIKRHKKLKIKPDYEGPSTPFTETPQIELTGINKENERETISPFAAAVFDHNQINTNDQTNTKYSD